MPRLIYDPRAVHDLSEIWRYIAMDSISRADSWMASIERTVQKLGALPHMGRAYSDLGKNIRGLPFGRYLILYSPLKDGIAILRILHGARDLNRTFHAKQ